MSVSCQLEQTHNKKEHATQNYSISIMIKGKEGYLPSWKAEVVLCLPMVRRVDEPKAWSTLFFFLLSLSLCYSVSMFIISSQCSALSRHSTPETDTSQFYRFSQFALAFRLVSNSCCVKFLFSLREKKLYIDTTHKCEKKEKQRDIFFFYDCLF